MRHCISIIGIGYVGLCTAAGFADKGFKVVASDIDEQKINMVKNGVAPFYEPNLNKLLKSAIAKRRLDCTLDQMQAVLNTAITFITVGTPAKPDGDIDLQYVENAGREVARALREKSQYHLVVLKSTVVPGTTECTLKPILEKVSSKNCGNDFGLCMNPEFLREGSALNDLINPDRIVIGEHDARSGDALLSVYKEFHGQKMPPIIRTSSATAEIIKYANNAFLATKISFINSIANICGRVPGIDVVAVADAIGLDPRIGRAFLNAGLGYGGSCFPKDLRVLIEYAKKLAVDFDLLDAVERVNENQPFEIIELCKRSLKILKGKRIAVLGLSFKPDTDDVREAKSLKVVERLRLEGAEVVVYDPVAIPKAKALFGSNISYASSAIGCIEGADCCVLVTEWDEFRKLKPEDFVKNMRNPILVDGRRIYNPKEYGKKLKFAAIGLGDTGNK